MSRRRAETGTTATAAPAGATPIAAGETVLATIGGATLVLLLSRPAFHAWFFGEAFLYLGQYWGAHERFWTALFSPSDVSFFKPVCFAASLPWYFLLPPDPFGYHVRNFVLTVVALALLHRVLLRVAPVRAARIFALGLFAASKVHLTTLGYLMIFDSILMLTFLLAAVLCALRWNATGAGRDRVFALGFTLLCAFTKDYGVVAVAVVAAFVVVRVLDDPAPARRRAFAAWLPPLALVAVLRIALRWAVVGAMPWSHPTYAPRFSADEVGRKALVLLSALTNASYGWHDKTGASGIGALVARLAPGVAGGSAADAIDAAVGAALVAALAASVVAARARMGGRALAPAAVWIAAFFAPPLFVRNLQIYYAYEPLAGVAIALAIAWSAVGARWRGVAAAAVALAIVGGFASNHWAIYDWQYAAARAREIAPFVDTHRGSALRSLSLVTHDVPFWRWTLAADDKAPMLEFLLRRPGLPVRIYDRAVLAAAIPPLDPAHVVLDADAGFAPVAVPRP